VVFWVAASYSFLVLYIGVSGNYHSYLTLLSVLDYGKKLVKKKNATNSTKTTFHSLLPQDVCKETICPLPCVRIKDSIQRLFGNCLGINDMGHTLSPLKAFQSFEKNLPSSRFARATRANHH
jgi:hypothetical protein